MIDRYTRPRMGRIWEEENKFRKWLEVELAVCEAWNELGEIPTDALNRIKNKARFSISRIQEVERDVQHDVLAFLTAVGESVGEDARYLHLGLTSYDVVDTALSLLLQDSLDVIQEDLVALQEVLKDQALQHKRTVMAGRTHGVHAEPITLGIKLLVWYEEVRRHLERLARARETVRVGRISGSVGTYIHLDPRVESLALKKLRLTPARISTQVLQRDRHAEVLSVLALIASSCDKFATEIRHLQKTEVQEIEEPFSEKQKGSSSMPHKRNPVRCERVSGLARLVRAHLLVALENIPLWHERDISHSSAERIIFPDSFIITDFLLAEMTDIIRNWKVRPERMRENIEATRGLVFSQALLLALTKKNVSRDRAYRLVQTLSFRAWEEKTSLENLALADPDIQSALSPEEVRRCFSLEPYLAKVDHIFERVLGNES